MILEEENVLMLSVYTLLGENDFDVDCLYFSDEKIKQFQDIRFDPLGFRQA